MREGQTASATRDTAIEAALLRHEQIEDCVVVERPEPAADQVRSCAACGISSRYPGISFDAAGVCDLCRFYQAHQKQIGRYFQTLDDLRRLFAAAASEKTGQYDCLLLYSGGKDSTYVLYQLVDLGLKVMTFTFDNGFISKTAFDNIQQITAELKIEHVTASAERMNQLFVESLKHHSSVCNGCFKALLGLSTQLAYERGIKYIVTGLSRGQIIDERLSWFYQQQIFDPEEIERQLALGRKVYHGVDDYATPLLDLDRLRDPAVLDEVRLIDFYRYTDVAKEDIVEYLKRRSAFWAQPRDTGFCSSNCMINDVGIYVHHMDRGYHNYEAPTRWEVRIGHLSREAAQEELRVDFSTRRVEKMLGKIGYPTDTGRAGQNRRLTAYYVAGTDITAATLRAHLQRLLPSHAAPAQFVRLDAMPRDGQGQPDLQALPLPKATRIDLAGGHVIPLQLQQPARAATSQPAAPGLVTGVAPLTPFQQWACDRPLPELRRWAGVQALEIQPGLQPALLKRAVLQLLVHHDALRMRFERVGAGWRQFNAGADSTLPFSQADISALPEPRQRLAQAAAVARLQAGLDLEQGPLIRVGVLERGAGQPLRLLIAMHALIADATAWQIVVGDLGRACAQLSRGEAIQLGPKTTAFKQWAERLASLAAADELAYWLDEVALEPTQLPVDTAAATTAIETLEVALAAGETQAFFQHPPDTREAALVGALAQTLAGWAGVPELRVDLERQARRQLDPDTDVARTVGQFGAVFPLRLAVAGSVRDTLARALARLQQVPQGGVGYGLLSSSSTHAASAERLRVAAPAAVYLDLQLPRVAALTPATFAAGPGGVACPPLRAEHYRLLVRAALVGAELRLRWTYHEPAHRQATIATLAQQTLETLRALIAGGLPTASAAQHERADAP